jgi:two-component system, NtrC family, response regulator AtoC
VWRFVCLNPGGTAIGSAGDLRMLPVDTNKGVCASPGGTLPPEEVMFGRSAAMQIIRQIVNKVVGMDVSVLLEGEGGTGKEVLARWIHTNSPWKSGPFVKVNCAAIPGTLLESELFGFESGAFTGANQRKPGRVELAQDGTLFLDDISEIDRGLQAKLLQFLQDGRFSRIGGQEELSVRTRVICATNKNLEREIDRGRFRSDLFYRINVVRIRLPKLQERLEDVPILTEYLQNLHMKQFGLQREPLSDAMICNLANFGWPGNIRELSNNIARYVLMGTDAAMAMEISSKRAKKTSVSTTGGAVPLKRIAKNAIVDMERHLIIEALQANRWNRKRAAQDLKISYRALIYKIREAGIVARKSAKSL